MFSKTTLKNGIKVISHEHKDSRAAYIEVRVKAGSKYCPPGKEGLTHFLEHMIMNGSSNYPGGTQVKRTVGNFGGKINASTGPESFGFWIKFAKEDLDKAGDVIFSIITKPLLAKEEMLLDPRPSAFKGFGAAKIDYRTSSFACNGCENNCEIIKIVVEDEVLARWGGRCGKWEVDQIRRQHLAPVGADCSTCE